MRTQSVGRSTPSKRRPGRSFFASRTTALCFVPSKQLGRIGTSSCGICEGLRSLRRTECAVPWACNFRDYCRVAAVATGTRLRTACETTAVRRIRRHMLEDRGLPLLLTVTRGYWRLDLLPRLEPPGLECSSGFFLATLLGFGSWLFSQATEIHTVRGSLPSKKHPPSMGSGLQFGDVHRTVG